MTSVIYVHSRRCDLSSKCAVPIQRKTIHIVDTNCEFFPFCVSVVSVSHKCFAGVSLEWWCFAGVSPNVCLVAERQTEQVCSLNGGSGP